ncbi:MAG: LacI family DNA-binding transcriptional regulator [Friedmanniella sp.]|jgi:LacI family transcriptional regulator
MATNGTTPTVRDVAQLAGVSPGTVSKALNGRGQLREETRLRVRSAAEKLGFQPNHSARSLLAGRTYTVGVLTSDSFGRFTLPVMEGIEDSLGAGQLSTLLCDGRGDPLRERHYLQELLNRRVDGLVVTGRRSDPRRTVGRLPIPVIYVLTRSDEPGDLSVTYDDAQGAELAIQHLLSVGRKRFAFVSGPPGHLASRLRRQGAERGLAAAGLTLAPENVLLGQWSEAWGRTAAGLLVRRPAAERVDGIFCGSDQVARGVADGLREAGVAVPDDVSVVGFDNWDVMVEASRPPLTTVDPNLTKLGQESASLLLTAIDGGELGTGVVLRPCELVLRESSVPA